MNVENLIFSGKVKKFTRFDFTKGRTLIITTNKIYIFKKTSKFISLKF